MSQILNELLTLHPMEWIIWFALFAPVVGGVIEHVLTVQSVRQSRPNTTI